jgi:hypothetical protein
MKLELGVNRTLNGPDADSIALALAGMDWKEDIFAKLSRDKFNYIQVCGTHSEGFILEYQDGSKERFFQAANKVNIEMVKSAFVAYSRGDGAWQSSIQWKQIDPDVAAGGRLKMWLGIIVAFAFLALFVVLCVVRLLAKIHQSGH